MAFAKASNKALTHKVGALLLSIHKYNRNNRINRIFEFLHLYKYNESIRRCQTMKEQKYHIYLTNQERSEIIESLIDFKNLRMQQGKYTDAVDEVLVKVIRAKKKKLKVVYI